MLSSALFFAIFAKKLKVFKKQLKYYTFGDLKRRFL
jgi:hypothetical protein